MYFCGWHKRYNLWPQHYDNVEAVSTCWLIIFYTMCLNLYDTKVFVTVVILWYVLSIYMIFVTVVILWYVLSYIEIISDCKHGYSIHRDNTV